MRRKKSLPRIWENISITTIYKKKRSKKKLKNHIGIFMTPILSKILEKLIQIRIQPHIDTFSSLFQASGKKNHSTADNIFLLRSLIDHATYMRSPIIFTLYDFETCFDTLWLEDSLNVLWDAGVTNDLFYVIYALNETCSIIVNTPFGQTSSIQIDNLVKQGTASGPVLCSTSIGDYCKENSSPRSGTYIGNACVKPLAFMDDLGDVNKNAEDSEKTHEDAIHFQKAKRLKFGYEKCEILIIGKQKLKTIPSFIG